MSSFGGDDNTAGRRVPEDEAGPGRPSILPSNRLGGNLRPLPSWQISLDQEISRLRMSLARTIDRSITGTEARVRIQGQLDAASTSLSQFNQGPWFRRLFLADSVYERVLSYLLTAAEDLLLIEDEDAVRARIPAIRAALKVYIEVSDPRFDSYLQYIDAMVLPDRTVPSRQESAPRDATESNRRPPESSYGDES